MAERDLDKEMEALRADLGRLREDLAGVVEALKESGKARADSARDGLNDLLEKVQDEFRGVMKNVREKGKDSVQTVEHQIEQRPLLSLVAAFGLGVVLAKLLDRR